MRPVRIKICGITRLRDAQDAVECGAWALGFVFYKKSQRFISPGTAKMIIRSLPPFVVPVGVFVNQAYAEIRTIAQFCGLTTLQFHGDETPAFCNRFSQYKIIKAFRIGGVIDKTFIGKFKVAAALLDKHKDGKFGGTGEVFDWSLIKKLERFDQPLILSGGINSRNIAQAFKLVNPYAVDVSSSLEIRPGIKSRKLIESFFANIGKLNK